MLSAMDAAMVLEDLRFPPGNHLEELKGDRAGQHSIRINDQWRIASCGPSKDQQTSRSDYH